MDSTKIQTHNPTLLDLLDESHQITRALIESEGQITPQIEEWINLHEKDITKKVDSIAWLQERLEIESKLFKEKAGRFSRIAKGLESTREFFRNKIKATMLSSSTGRIDGDDYGITVSTSGSKIVFRFDTINEADALAIAQSEGFTRSRTVIEFDKERIEAALKDNTCCLNFVHLEPIHTLRFSIAKNKLKGR